MIDILSIGHIIFIHKSREYKRKNQMDGLKLNPGERVIQENSNVGYGGLLLNNSLILTNQNLILVKKTC